MPKQSGVRGRSEILAALILFALSASVFLGGKHGWYFADTRFLFNWNPRRQWVGNFAVWQTSVDLGGPANPGMFLPVSFMTVLRGIGFPAWVAQRLWFCAVLTLGATGAALLAGRLLKRRTWWMVLAGVAFMSSPYTVGAFTPTWLFLSVAIAPWLVVAALSGPEGTSSWRWAALSALLFTSAMYNPPAVAFACLPAVAALFYLRFAHLTPWRTIARWLMKAALFLMPLLIPLVIASWLNRGAQYLNLASSESLQAISQSSSWSESIRGLGNWLVYWNPSGRLVLPAVSSLMTSWPVVAASFLFCAVAIAAVAVSRRPGRWLLAVVFVASAALMVGVYPYGREPPAGFVLRWLYEARTEFFGFRNVYKAGAGLGLAAAVLVAMAVDGLASRARRWASRLLLAVSVAALLLTVGFPMWSGALLNVNQRLHGDVPTYWRDAFRWLDEQPGAGRVLVSPVSNSAEYRWGAATGGDMFESLMRRPTVLGGVFPYSPGEAGNLVQVLSNYVSNPVYEPGTLAPIARRLGIRFLVIRNDLAWERTGVVRPSALQRLRTDPSLVRLRTFGRRGQNTVPPDDVSPSADKERRLHPVEVFEIQGAAEVSGLARATVGAPQLLVSGDGEAWPSLATTGFLSSLGPVRYTGSAPRTDLAEQLAQGATLVVTDTNRRRGAAYGRDSAVTLDPDVTRRVSDLFGSIDTQTFAWYGDARSVREVRTPQLYNAGLSHGAWAAFDGDPRTTWLTGGLDLRPRARLEINLRQPRPVSSVFIRSAVGDGVRRISEVEIRLGNGRARKVRLDASGAGQFSVTPRDVRRIEIAVTRAGPSGPYGFAEVTVGGLDLVRRAQLPTDVVGATGQPAILRQLQTAPISYQFSRLVGVPQDAEPTMRRRFRVAIPRPFGLTGSLQVRANTPDEVVSALLGGPLQATVFPVPASGAYETRGIDATDGDASSAWIIDPGDARSLDLTSTTADLRTIEVSLRAATVTEATSLELKVGREVIAPARNDCLTAGSSTGGDERCVITFQVPGERVSRARLTVTAENYPLRVYEVTANGRPNSPRDLSARCSDGLLSIDGVSTPIIFTGTSAEIRSGASVPFSGCADLELIAGWHELGTVAGLPVNRAALGTVDGRTPIASAPVAVRTTSSKTTSFRTVVKASGPRWLISGQAMLEGWEAKAGSERLQTVGLDTQAAWLVTGDANRAVRAVYSVQSPYRFAVIVSLVGYVIVVATIVVNPYSSRRDRRTRGSAPQRLSIAWWRVGSVAVAMAFAFGVGGALEAALVAILLLANHRLKLPRAFLPLAAASFIVVAGAVSLPPIGPSLRPVTPIWPAERQLAHFLSLQAAVFVVVAVVARVLAEPRSRPRVEPAAPVSSPRPPPS